MLKKQIKYNLDFEAIMFMFVLQLKEEKNKKYSTEESDKHSVYLFNNYDEFKSYFLENGVDDLNNKLLELNIMKVTKKGTIISLKDLCDYTITKYLLKKAPKSREPRIPLVLNPGILKQDVQKLKKMVKSLKKIK